MLITCFVTILLNFGVQCQNLLILHNQRESQSMMDCTIGILDKYFSEENQITYVSMTPDDQELMAITHSKLHFSFITRESTHQMFAPNFAYLLYSLNVETFKESFISLTREPLWNPYARFLIIIKSLQEFGLRQIFDEFLDVHVKDVVLINGTDNTYLYTYNPYDNYACGRYYNNIINYGLCSETKEDLYPDKLITGLRNCTFRATVAHNPPFAIDPSQNEFKNRITGVEQYILNTVSETDGFKIEYDYNFSGIFTTVTSNMTVIGPMDILQNNITDVIFGAMMLIASRAAAFSIVCGYHDYVDELRFAVQKASLVPNWKNIYLEFDLLVWILVMIALLLYSAVMIYLLKSKDKGAVMLALLDNLLLHGRVFNTTMSIKCVLLMWVWFAYLINTFYQSSLVSLTTNPVQEYQIEDEYDMERFNLRPCVATVLANYLYTELDEIERFNDNKINDITCDDIIEGMKLVSKNNNMFALIPSYFYQYNKQAFNDKWGDPLIYYFEKPYAKFILSYYFYKGFPVTHRMLINMFHMRENGLAEKNLRDQYFLQSIKFKFYQKELGSRFVFPWQVYALGCLLSTITFVFELVIHSQRHRSNL